jgi:hypothetical protein
MHTSGLPRNSSHLQLRRELCVFVCSTGGAHYRGYVQAVTANWRSVIRAKMAEGSSTSFGTGAAVSKCKVEME